MGRGEDFITGLRNFAEICLSRGVLVPINRENRGVTVFFLHLLFNKMRCTFIRKIYMINKGVPRVFFGKILQRMLRNSVKSLVLPVQVVCSLFINEVEQLFCRNNNKHCIGFHFFQCGKQKYQCIESVKGNLKICM